MLNKTKLVRAVAKSLCIEQEDGWLSFSHALDGYTGNLKIITKKVGIVQIERCQFV